jgi:competence/damage-inducible protein CinA-like protein
VARSGTSVTHTVDRPAPQLRRAAVLAVGTELLTALRPETNTSEIARALETRGLDVVVRGVVRDNEEEIARTLDHARSLADLVVITGGLGPTDDDVTREAVRRALGRLLVEDAAIVEQIRKRFSRRGMTMPEINRRQGRVIQGAMVLANPNGSAPGQLIADESRVIVLLPGPPRELRPMLGTVLDGALAIRLGARRLLRRELRVAGRSESWIEERMQPLYVSWRAQPTPVDATILTPLPHIELHLSAWSEPGDDAEAALEAAAAATVAALGDAVFTVSGESIEKVVGRQLLARGWRIAVAESCTGGLVGTRLTDVPGSSAWFERGIVAYSNDAKIDLLGVDRALIDEHGAVSEPVALAMAKGIRQDSDVDVGVAVTGIAGPTGGTDAKPVGTVVVAAEMPDVAEVRTLRLLGDRWMIRAHAAQSTLDLVRRRLDRST